MQRGSNPALPFVADQAAIESRTRPPVRNEPISGADPKPRIGEQFSRDGATIHFQPAETLYGAWPRPTCIVADGPYGVSGFPGDHHTAATLPDWYRPHIAAWSERATPETTLWFWNTEIGWASVHPVLDELGWEYRTCHVWDKGLGHVAGNANSETLRKLPVVTEVCVQYVRRAEFAIDGRRASMQDWLRHEWVRSGLPMYLANGACGVKNAATRKYLTADHLWYYPPPDAFALLAQYVNEHGRPEGRPYFSVDGQETLTAALWARLRAKFHCPIGVTNVWSHPQVGGRERINGERTAMQYKFRSLHGSQKPLKLIELAINSSTDRGDVVWEPFGGLCPAAISALNLGRVAVSAEIIPEFYLAAVRRLRNIK